MPLNKIKHTALASDLFDNIADDQIVLNSARTGTPSAGQHVGIKINRGSSNDVEIRYNETLDYWEITNDGTTFNRIATTGGASGIGNVSEDASPQLGGDLESNSHDIQMADNDKIAFGTGEKGKIDHNGSLLQIFETTGGIDIKTFADNSSVVISSDDSLGGIAPYFKADGSTGESLLYWYGTERLKASNNGIIVTGTLNTHTIPAGTGTLALTSQVASDTDGLPEGSTNKYYSDAQVATYLAGGSVANVIIGGNLTVNGTQTTVNSNNVNVGDNIITLNSDEAGVPSQDAGIEVERGSSTNVVLRWNETNDRWEYTNDGTTYSNIGDIELSLDTSPQLGGNLDCNTHNIILDNDDSIRWNSNAAATNIYGKSSSLSQNSYLKFYLQSSSNSSSQVAEFTENGIIITSPSKGFNLQNFNTAINGYYDGNITHSSTNFLTANREYNLPDASGTFMLNLVEDTTPQLGGNLDVNGKSITSTGDLTIDIAGELILDADTQGSGNGILLKDAGTLYGSIFRSNSDLHIKSEAQDEDLFILGNDGGSEITALTFDMSEAGAATFGASVTSTTFIGVGTGGYFYLLRDSSKSCIRSESDPIVMQTYESSAWQDRFSLANGGPLTIQTGTATGGSNTANVAEFNKYGNTAGANIVAYEDATGHSCGFVTNIDENTGGAVALQNATNDNGDAIYGLMYFQDTRNTTNNHVFSSYDGSTYRTQLTIQADNSKTTMTGKLGISGADISNARGGYTDLIIGAGDDTGTDNPQIEWYNASTSWAINHEASDSGMGFVYNNGTSWSERMRLLPTLANFTGAIRASGDITAFYSSDAKLKENVATIDGALDKVMAIRGVTFDWKDEHIEQSGGEDGYFVRKQDIGFIAQELEPVLPELVRKREDDTLAVDYQKMVSVLAQAIKEQQEQINSLTEKLNALTN